jgi:hypothetical protein
MENKEGKLNYIYETKTIFRRLGNPGAWTQNLNLSIDPHEVVVKSVLYVANNISPGVITCNFIDTDEGILCMLGGTDLHNPESRHRISSRIASNVRSGTVNFQVKNIAVGSQTLQQDDAQDGDLYITCEFRKYYTPNIDLLTG